MTDPRPHRWSWPVTLGPTIEGMTGWPATPAAARMAMPVDRENHVLDVYVRDSRPVDIRLDGESLFPIWFKLEFKESGEVSAKVKGLRLATRFGDTIHIHQLQSSAAE